MNKILQKLFLTHSYFTVALRPRAEEGVTTAPDFRPAFVLPAAAERWAADPILAEEDGRTWLFYEAVDHDHGHIEAAEVLPDCSLGKPTVILQDACHYSYPFVFRWEGLWYMIPESSAARELRLYQAEEFPFRWRLREVLLRERAVDTTVYEAEGSLRLLTFLTEAASERVTPRAYALTLNAAEAALRPLDWADFDPLRVRGAGPVFEEDGVLWRPVQRNQEQRYGDAVELFRLRDRANAHEEEAAGLLRTPMGKIAGLYVDGAHTYCRSSQFEAVDLRCRDFDLWKLPRRLIRRMKG